jgi:hypothetical protein
MLHPLRLNGPLTRASTGRFPRHFRRQDPEELELGCPTEPHFGSDYLIFEGISADEHTLWPGQFPQLWGHVHLRPARP